jgi:L-lactate dehydrogenase complex protein LldE
MKQVSEEGKIGLFNTCLVDTFRPSIALATLEVLEAAGCKVHVPMAQTCCGLTSWNIEDQDDAREMALKIIKQFKKFDYVVTPSKSCAAMIQKNYPVLFCKDPTWKEPAEQFASKIYELTDFIRNILNQSEKLDHEQTGLVGDDLALLLQSAAKMNKENDKTQVHHIAEVMAGQLAKRHSERSS